MWTVVYVAQKPQEIFRIKDILDNNGVGNINDNY